ncbi:hypothetical protein [Planosporangium mesophilum]|uniref:Uncharacterized protein n=1 Tax=Planosporangium mesophilum TaxID=689768 RepID=A0A8J3X1W3_9ACTN|nr:hypothetical protein [Planosporangium mesophilum]GII24847.1 hypothetical protein Pme01_44440 [Planosporangium mesophilum]
MGFSTAQYEATINKPTSGLSELSAKLGEVGLTAAKLRALGERAVATLKGWKVLTKLRWHGTGVRGG